MLKLMFAVIILLLLPFLAGLFCVRLSGKRLLNPLTAAAIGYAVILTLFQVIYIYFLRFDNRFIPLQTASQIILGTLCLLSLICSGKVIIGYIHEAKQFVKNIKSKPIDIENLIYGIILVLLIGFLIYKSVFFGYADDDDAYYLADAVRLQNTGYSPMHMINPYTGFTTDFNVRHSWAAYTALVAVLANTIGIHAAALAHFVFPPIMILIVNGIYGSIFSAFFRRSENRTRAVSIALILINLLNIFGNSSIFTNMTFLLTRTWQGKSMLANVMIPLAFLILFYIGIDATENESRGSKLSMIGLFMILSFIICGGASLSAMALMLIPSMAGVGMIWICAVKKNARLIIYFALSLVLPVLFGISYIVS